MATKTVATRGRMTEEDVMAKYHHVVKGTLRWHPKIRKASVLIRCTVKGCGKTRRIYTSDCFQVKNCGDH